jgi:hypothetical protein
MSEVTEMETMFMAGLDSATARLYLAPPSDW